jgi:hypothetical protein
MAMSISMSILTDQGQILEEWFGRSVIRSCAKLSYDHAQGFIEEPDREWTAQELPPISAGFTIGDLKTRVLQMDKVMNMYYYSGTLYSTISTVASCSLLFQVEMS